MASFTKQLLSGSTNGRNVKVSQTVSPGTLIHTAHATSKDEIWLWACNTDTAEHKLTIEFGGTAAPDDLIEVKTPAEGGALLVIPGWPLTGSAAVSAFADAANVVVVNGYVNRIG